MNNLVIFGCGGHAREILQIVLDLNASSPAWNILGFLDDDPDLHQTEVLGFKVLGGPNWLVRRSDVVVSVAIGSPSARKNVVQQITGQSGNQFATIIHPRARVVNRASIGNGSIIFAGSMISSDVVIGQHVVINFNSSVSHDSRLADYVTVGPGVNICGNVSVRDGTELGAGCTIVPRTDIGNWSVIGAGTVVIEDLDSNITAVGNPARIIEERTEGWQNVVQ